MNNSPVTFVNFCVDIGRGDLPDKSQIKRDFALYEVGMMENIDTKVPLVVYSSVKDIKIPEHRNESNLQINFFDTNTLEQEFPDFELYRKTYPITHKDEIASSLFYYAPLVVCKMKKMMDVINENPFNSEYFFWMDCHFTRGIFETNFLH